MSKAKQSISRPRCEREYVAKQRQCLMCADKFLSHWPGERVCPRCKGTHAWKDGGNAFAA